MKHFALLVALIACPLSIAQSVGSDWNQTSVDTSRYIRGGFLPDGRVIVHQEEYNSAKVICLDPSSGQVWSTAVTAPIRDMLVTTDGYVYLIAKPRLYSGPNKPYIYALNSATGAIAWQYTLDYYEGQLFEMRVFGGNLLVGGTTNDPILMSFNRTTGTINYSRAYPSSNSESGITKLRATSQFLFAALNGGISKIDPANGNIIASRANLAFEDFQVDSASNVYVGRDPDTYYSNGYLSRFNFSGTGSVPDPLYTAPNEGIRSMMLAGGFVYGAYVDRLVKYRPSDGSVVWTREVQESWYTESFKAMKADALGKLHVITEYLEMAEFSSGQLWYNGNWTYRILDPMTGLDLASMEIASSDHTKHGEATGHGLYLNAFGEALLVGSRALYAGVGNWGPYYRSCGYAVIAYQTPIPQADFYTCAENEIFASTGNGVLKNDRFVNPSATTAILISPPAQGNLILQTNGEFTYDAAGVAPGDYTFVYEASRGELSGTVTSMIRVARGLLRLTLTRNTLAGQNSTLATVTMSSPGAASNVTVSDDSSLVTTPSSVTVPIGQTLATFGIQVVPVTSQHLVTIRASNGGFTRTATLTLVPLIPTALAFSPGSTVVGGTTVSCRLVLNGVAGPGGRVVSVYDNNVYSTVPNQVTVPAGASQVIFQIQTTRPPTLQVSRITAAVTAGTVNANLRITP